MSSSASGLINHWLFCASLQRGCQDNLFACSSELRGTSQTAKARIQAEVAWTALHQQAGLPVHIFRLGGTQRLSASPPLPSCLVCSEMLRPDFHPLKQIKNKTAPCTTGLHPRQMWRSFLRKINYSCPVAEMWRRQDHLTATAILRPDLFETQI